MANGLTVEEVIALLSSLPEADRKKTLEVSCEGGCCATSVHGIDSVRGPLAAWDNPNGTVLLEGD